MKAFKIILSFVLISSSQLSFGGEELILLPSPVQLIKSEIDPSLSKNEAVYHFTFTGIENQTPPQTITYTVDGVEFSKPMITEAAIDIKTTPGKHVFSFFVNVGFSGINTDSLDILPKFQDDYQIHFVSDAIQIQPRDLIIETCKPVIYLYPQKEMEVEVKLDFVGEHPFLYPAYNDGWKCVAHPNGDLTIDSETYNYLFWEANQPDHLNTADLKEGFIVKGKNAISFLKNKLTTAGLTSKEQADFITFWGPLIQKNELNFVRFEFNEICDKFTKLNITPTPDQVYRIYIFFSPIDAAYDVTEQEIQPIKREGFTVLEWGGQKSNPIQINTSTI